VATAGVVVTLFQHKPTMPQLLAMDARVDSIVMVKLTAGLIDCSRAARSHTLVSSDGTRGSGGAPRPAPVSAAWQPSV
jgi:hypothetical protein